MLKSFCASSNLKALLQGENCPEILWNAVTILRGKWDNKSRKDALPPAQGHSITVAKFMRVRTEHYRIGVAKTPSDLLSKPFRLISANGKRG